MGVLKYDPQRITTLRGQFIRDLKRRFTNLKLEIARRLVRDNLYGLDPSTTGVVANTDFEFLTNPEKARNFRDWLKGQIDQGILEVDEQFRSKPWLATYVESAYKKATTRAYLDAKKGMDVPEQAQFLSEAFSAPTTIAQVELLATRAFEGLRGITESMSSEMNRVFSDGMAHGTGAREVARQLVKSVDGITRKRALVLARTELSNAYAEGQLDGFDRLGIDELEVQVEFDHAGDDRVCPICLDLGGLIVESTSAARGIIPVHPNCRCAWLPYFPAKKEERKRRVKEIVQEKKQDPKPKPTPQPAPAPTPKSNAPQAPQTSDVKKDRVAKVGSTKLRHAALTQQEGASLREYQAAMFGSETGGYTTLQQLARSGTLAPHLEEHREKATAFIRTLDVAMTKSVVSEKTTVYRGIRDSVAAMKLKPGQPLKVGHRWVDEGFTSTTAKKKLASDKFAQRLNYGDQPRVLHIELEKGQQALSPQIMRDIKEAEVTLPRGLEFEVTKIRGDNIYVKIVGRAEEAPHIPYGVPE